MPLYLFGENSHSSDDENWQYVLRKAYAAKVRPVCRCVVQPAAPALYIAIVSGLCVLKRLPFSGPLHASHCMHYEPPPELSGLGQVNGSAIREDFGAEGTVLALDFALSKGRARPNAATSDVEHESVRSDGTKLTMRALLHYLYDQAGLTRWSPAMEGKRSWFVVRREILAAAISKRTKGRALTEILFLPESFTLEHADSIRSRRLESLAALSLSPDARMILIGEVKSLEEARYGMALVIKHLPDIRFLVADDLGKRLTKRFAHQLQLWSELEATKLLIICTISRSVQGTYSVEAACLVNVDQRWIPFESSFEWSLLDVLHADGRRFVKGLRYNLPSTKPMASVVLQDSVESSTALYLVTGDSEGAFRSAAQELSEATGMAAWLWKPGHEAMPDLPRKAPERPNFSDQSTVASE